MQRILRMLIALAVAAMAVVTMGAGTDQGDHDMGDHDMGGHDMGGSGGSTASHTNNAPVARGARRIVVDATSSLRFAPRRISLEAKEDVVIVLESEEMFHDFVVKGIGHVVGAKAGKAARGGLRIDEPGTYKFWCSVPGHRSAGMKGTITVA